MNPQQLADKLKAERAAFDAEYPFEIDKDLEKIIVKAIIAESCPIRNMDAMHRRSVLKKELRRYISELCKKSGLTLDWNGRIYRRMDQPIAGTVNY